MVDMCVYCKLDTGGNHAFDCPNNNSQYNPQYEVDEEWMNAPMGKPKKDLIEFNPDYADDPKVLHGIIKDQGESIGNLQSRIAELEKQLAEREWVSVENRLPTTVDDVELMYVDGLIIKGYYSDGSFYPNYDIDINHDAVTHWQPIHLPKKEQALKGGEK